MSIALIMISINSCLKKKKIIVLFNIINCIIFASGLCWNFEFGFIALIMYAAYFVFSNAVSHGFLTKNTIFTSSKAFLFIFSSFTLSIVIIELITYTLSGQFLGREQLFFGITVCTGIGYFMLPINYIGVWLIVAIILLVGLSIAISSLVSPKNSGTAKANTIGLFAASVMGIGAFSYFVGRSHKEVIMNIIPECVLVCALLAEFFMYKLSYKSIRAIKEANTNEKKNTALYSVNALLCLTFILYCTTICFNTLMYNFSEKYNSKNFGDHSLNMAYEKFDKPAKEIEKWADMNNNGELPNMLTFYSVYYDELLGKKAYENVCEMIDWFFKHNAHSYLDFINEHPNEAFVISESAINILESEFKEEFDSSIKNFRLSAKINASEFEHNMLYIYLPF